MSITPAGARIDPLELRSLPILEGNTCSRESECGGGHALKGHADVQRVDPTSGGCGTDLGSFWMSVGGSLNARCAQFFSLWNADAPLGIDMLAHVWPHVLTLTLTQASSTRALYDCKWRVFKEWCAHRSHIPFQCSVGVILSFLQDVISTELFPE